MGDTSGAYIDGDRGKAQLQRDYGLSFPTRAMLGTHVKLMEERKERDHRKILRDQELVMFHKSSPGAAFFLPHGTRLYNRLNSYIQRVCVKNKYINNNTHNNSDHSYQAIKTP